MIGETYVYEVPVVCARLPSVPELDRRRKDALSILSVLWSADVVGHGHETVRSDFGVHSGL